MLREWAILFFPLNWSKAPGIALRGALAMLPVVWIACVLLARIQARACLRSIVGAVGMTILAGLPVQHLLLVGPDLSGAFRVYLPSVGLAVLWSQLFDGMPARLRAVIACILVLINSAILEHNLAAWRSTAHLAKAVCVSFGRSRQPEPNPLQHYNGHEAREQMYDLINAQVVKLLGTIATGDISDYVWLLQELPVRDVKQDKKFQQTTVLTGR